MTMLSGMVDCGQVIMVSRLLVVGSVYFRCRKSVDGNITNTPLAHRVGPPFYILSGFNPWISA